MRLRLLIGGLAALPLALLLATCQKGVLNAPPMSTINLNASPNVIPETAGESTIRAVVRLPDGTLIPDGVVVNFFTTLGTIDAEARTVSGTATVTLRSTGTPGTATVSALSGGTAVSTVDVTFGAAAGQVRVSFSPAALPENGGTATVTVRVSDAAGAPLVGRTVTLMASAGQLGSRGQVLFTDVNGIVTDTISSTSATTVTATSGGLTGAATLAVARSPATAIALIASPPSLPSGGGSSLITAFATDAGSAPVGGATVTFSTSRGSLLPATATTDASGRATATLDTDDDATVTASIGSVQAHLTVAAGIASTPYRIVLTASRASVSQRTPLGAMACVPAVGQEMPIEVLAQVTDLAGHPIAGLSVTLEIDDTSDAFDGRGGFCGSGSVATCNDPSACLVPRPDCPTPTPTPPAPTPPTPTPMTPTPVCCPPGTGTLGKTAVAGTDAAGLARFSFAFEDPDLCDGIFAHRRITARILASAPLATGANDLVLTFNP